MSVIEDDWTEEEFQEILEGRGEYLRLSKADQEYVQRWDDLKALQEHYPLFKTFMIDCFKDVKGFDTDELQQDIANFMQEKIRYKMVQAQRAQAKSMIAGAYAVWRIIHDPKLIVLIISAGADVADEIATWVKLVIDNWDILECLRPDRQHGDRTSATAFDIHWMLKGPDKSPSVRSIGITSNLAGRRAGLLIPDDIESAKNGLTQKQRQQLIHLSKDFSSICNTGDILYLGTPQSVDSLYNGLEERGFTVRIWPGRYPTREEEEYYGDRLAPYIKKKVLDDPTLRRGGGVNGDRGKPTSDRKNEEQLTADELDKGPAYFNLQVMLDTTLSDRNLYPLKVRNLIVLDVAPDKGPANIVWLPDQNKKVILDMSQKKHDLFYPFNISELFVKWEDKVMAIDPAGGGGTDGSADETVAVVSFLLNGYIHIPEMLATEGGHGQRVFNEIAELCVKYRIYKIQIEENMDHGAFGVMLLPVLRKAFKDAELPGYPIIENHWETANKQKRMIDNLQPVMARHKLVISPEVLDYDVKSTARYPDYQKESFQLLHQMARVTYMKDCLIHDDRLDALTSAVRYWKNRMNVDEEEKEEAQRRAEFMATVNQLLGNDKKSGGNIKNRRACFRNRGKRR